MLLTGGSAVLTSLTGVRTAAACLLLPIGVVLYTLFGGIKATFIMDYVHTVVIIVVTFLFAFSAYATNSTLGSPGKVYDALVAAANLHPVDGNAQGSYLTMQSREGGIFWVINLVGNFGCVFYDSDRLCTWLSSDIGLFSSTMVTITRVCKKQKIWMKCSKLGMLTFS